MSAVTRWWLIRHAPVPNPERLIYGRSDPPADTSEGPAALALSRSLPADAVWIVTPRQRTRQTATALHPATEPLVEPDLAEQDFGVWEGMSHDGVALWHPEGSRRFWAAPATETPPKGESFATVMARVAGAVQRLTAAHPGRDLVAVIHAGSIRAALALALDLSPEAALRLRIDPWSLTRIDHFATGEGEAGAWAVNGVNLPPGTFSPGGR